ncbi:MAG: hypothetical protein LBH00_11965 [Planctomycetaceae bacterium]|jgi:hypothetical protein|nr:hypothetical protein [Planctomycetaceae bacterium]
MFPHYRPVILFFSIFTAAGWGLPGFCQTTLSQTLPPLIPSHTRTFSIPFETAGDSVREVEVLVSQDRGKRWYTAVRQDAAAKKIIFNAETDGEYWFAFRTISASGAVSPARNTPQLRVAVSTAPAGIVLPPRQTDSGPVLPPKPEKFTENRGQKPAEKAVEKTAEKAAVPQAESKTEKSAVPADAVFGPTFSGFTPSAAPDNVLDELLSKMGAFADIQPAVSPVHQPAAHAPPAVAAATPAAGSTGNSAGAAAGGITEITMNNKISPPQIIVKWNTGDPRWQDAQIDILRKPSEQEPAVPIATNLPNSGEYWWYLSPNDLKPFFITVRIRSLHGGILQDTTRSAISIDPKVIR